MRKKIKTICMTSILLITMLGITTTVSANGNGGDGGDDGGLTPGFWKNHLGAWVDFEDDDELDDPFNFPAELADFREITLLEALRFHGGKGVEGAARILLRAAVAGLLNYESLSTGNPEFEYPMTYYEIVSQVNSALASGDRDTMLDLKDIIDDYNNLGL